MFAVIAALALAPATAATAAPSAKPPAASALSAGSAKAARHPARDTLPAGPWWEKLTVTMDGDGTPKSCEYQSSTKPEAAADCALVGADFGDKQSQDIGSSKDEYLKLTFERRFSPGATAPAPPPLQTGDTLLGSEMMALAISPKGKVTGCKIVASTGDMPPDYSCDDASAEQFADSGKGAPGAREGFMSVRIYGHSESLTMRGGVSSRRA